MATSLFTGLGDLFQPQNNGPTQQIQQLRVFAAQVVDVCMDENSPIYSTARDIGKITFKDPIMDYNKSEQDYARGAYPLDRSIARYPVPGEEVIIFRALGDIGTISDTQTFGNIYFYSFVVSALHNISYNVDPFIGSNSDSIGTSPEQAAARFDKKRMDLDLSKDASNNIKIYKQLQPYEGDFIIQGRFGNTIRLGSTSPKIETPWAKDGSAPGVSGDGIMILRVDRDSTTTEDGMFTTEDIDVDDSTIYLCTSQRVELTLSCSRELKSWKARYNLKDDSKNAGGNISKTKDPSELWQKVIDGEKPVDQQFQSPTQ